MIEKNNRVLMLMSGGLDSGIAAKLLLEQGYELVGITLKVIDDTNSEFSKNNYFNAINDARELAYNLGFPHYVIDYRKEFQKNIINNFINEYVSGRTPNPCVLCNSLIKWGETLKKADQFNCYYIATGHYANIFNIKNRYFIQKGTDPIKDQSYMLWGLQQNDLKRSLFPLGKYHKTQIRQIAINFGYKKLENKKESYDICFIPDNNYHNFLNKMIPDLDKKYDQGDFITKDKKVVGKHKGFPYYTIGQRKGLLAMGEPYYVTDIDAKNNKIVIGKKDDLLSSEMIISNVNWQKIPVLNSDIEVNTKIRYRHEAIKSIISPMDNGFVKVKFSKPVSAVTPGQSAVFYKENDLVGGGIIEHS